MIFTTDTIITSVKSRTLAPISQNGLQNSDIIRFANEELVSKLVPDMISVREDFFLKTKSYTLSPSISNYTMPERSLGNTLKQLFFVDGSGNSYSIPRMNVLDIAFNNISDSNPNHFYYKGDQIVVVPTPNTAGGGTLNMFYYQRPNQLVLTASTAKITSIATNGSNKQFTVDTDLTASLSSASLVDFLSAKSPFLLWSEDVSIVSITSTVITVATSSIVDGAGSTILPQVGDYICAAQQANIPMVPQEFHPLLAEMTAERVMQALGHMDKIAAIKANIAELRKQMMTVIANRAEQHNEKIVNRNSLSRQSGAGWTNGYVR